MPSLRTRTVSTKMTEDDYALFAQLAGDLSVDACAYRSPHVTVAPLSENGQNERIVRARRSHRGSRPTTAPEPPAASPATRAALLLEAIRRTRMTRGRLAEPKRLLSDHIASTMTDRGVPARLANRIAFQLVLKCEPAHLGSRTTWQAMGDQVHVEIEQLRQLGLVDRQIIVALPKLAATQVDALLDGLRVQDPAIARTILNVALDAAEPVPAAQRYLREFRRVVAHLKTVDPSIARTIANATFMARMPTGTATVHYKRFAQLFSTFHDDVAFARTVAKTACRSADPLGVAERVIVAYHAIRSTLADKGAAPEIARSLAGIASVAAEPMPTASKLLENFGAVLTIVKETHPSVARSIALAACRTKDPEGTARQYLKNYDNVLRFVRRTDPDLAHVVALQTCRTNNPMRWAKRFLQEQRRKGT